MQGSSIVGVLKIHLINLGLRRKYIELALPLSILIGPLNNDDSALDRFK